MGPKLPYKVYPIKVDVSAYACTFKCNASYFENHQRYIFVFPYISSDMVNLCRYALMEWKESMFKFQNYAAQNCIDTNFNGNFVSYKSSGSISISNEIATVSINFSGGGGNTVYNQDGLIIEIQK